MRISIYKRKYLTKKKRQFQKFQILTCKKQQKKSINLYRFRGEQGTILYLNKRASNLLPIHIIQKRKICMYLKEKKNLLIM